MPSVEAVKRATRRAKKINAIVEKTTDYSQLRVYETEASGAFHSPLNSIPLDTQRMLLDMVYRGKSIGEIFKETRIPTSTIQAFVERKAISPMRCKAYRCGGCGCKVVAIPCFVCESRRMAGVHCEG